MKIDIDALFDNYLQDFIDKNSDKYTPEQIERMIETIYEDFGKKPNLSLAGLSPIQYFKQKKTQELISEFKESFQGDNQVCEFLCRELQKREDAEDDLISFSNSKNDEMATCSVNILCEMNSKKSLKSFINSILDKRATDGLLESMVDAMCKNADLIKEELLEIYDVNNPVCKVFLEVFASMSRDERVYQILFDEYLNRKNNRAEIYGLLAKYGDDKILGYLYGEVENTVLNPIELEEIKLAIEKLGGDFNHLIVKSSH